MVLVAKFLLELAALAAFAAIGASLSEMPWALALAILSPAVAATAWGRWAAPRSQDRLAGPQRVLFESAFFVSAALGLAAIGAQVAAGLLGGAAAVVTVALARAPS